MLELLFVAVHNYNSVALIHKDTGLQDSAIANQPGTHRLAIRQRHRLAFDVDWRLYVAESTDSTRRAISVLPPGGTGLSARSPPPACSALAFGRGSLACSSLYAADAVGAVRLFLGQPLGVTSRSSARGTAARLADA